MITKHNVSFDAWIVSTGRIVLGRKGFFEEGDGGMYALRSKSGSVLQKVTLTVANRSTVHLLHIFGLFKNGRYRTQTSLLT